MTRIKSLPSLNSKEELSSFYMEWIAGLGKVKDCKKCNTIVPDSIQPNFDLSWINDSSIFTKEFSAQLKYIIKNRNQGKKYYVKKSLIGFTQFDVEKPYKDSVFPSPELRLLGLSRYWNIINYFFPYKYLIGEDWNRALDIMIPAFKDSKYPISYHLAMLELVNKTNDSHAALYTRFTNQYFGNWWAPFKVKLVDGKAIVTGLYNDSLAKIDDISYGDVFLKLNGEDVAEIIKEKSKYVGASNEPTKLRNFSYILCRSQIEIMSVVYERDGLILSKTIHAYGYEASTKFNWNANNSTTTSKILEGNIGYVDMGLLKLSEVSEVVRKLKNTKAIIFDVRNYPQGTMYKIARFLNKERKPFAKFTDQNLSYPGTFSHVKPYSCGRKNKNYYKGKVVLLMNEETQSHAEFTCMALQTAPDVISIGSQTAGADGNIIVLTFPGDYHVWMTGLGVYYPDGRETQRIGIVPDIEVKPTIEGIRAHRDEVLEKAIEVINTAK